MPPGEAPIDLREAVTEGAFESDGDVRLRRIREFAEDEAIAAQIGRTTLQTVTQHVPEATLEDLEWADVLIFGTQTRFGLQETFG